jgi:predicted DNA-binding transcriptional regulator YafY
MRGDQLARQWQLIQHLARSRAGVGLDELAEELGCVRRTVYRDLDALMYAGFPLVSEKRDSKVYYRFLDSFQLGDVPFTADEIMALAFSEDLLRTLEGTVFHDSICSALGKIRAGLGHELSSYLDRLAEVFRVLPGPHKRYAECRDTIHALNEAVLTRRTLSMRYRTGRTGEETSRKLDPYRVWYRSGGLYVIGHDHRSDEIRTFAVDRILEIAQTDARFDVPESFDFDAYTASSFGVIAEPATKVRIAFTPEWAPHVREREWHASQRLEDRADGGVDLMLEVGATADLASWILSFGAGAEVLEPVSLRSEVEVELRAAIARYAVTGPG